MSENGQKVCPKCGEVVDAHLVDNGFELNSDGNGIVYSMMDVTKIEYNCPRDGTFVDKEKGNMDYFTGC